MEQGLSNKGLPRSKRMWPPSSSVPILCYSTSPEFMTVRLLSSLPTTARTLHCHGLRLRIQRHDCRRGKTSSGVFSRILQGAVSLGETITKQHQLFWDSLSICRSGNLFLKISFPSGLPTQLRHFHVPWSHTHWLDLIK